MCGKGKCQERNQVMMPSLWNNLMIAARTPEPISNLALRMLARASPNRKVIKDLTDCGFTGATVEAADLGETENAGAMLRTVLALQRIGPSVLVHAVRSVAGLTAVRAAGANWASLDIVPGGLESAKLAAITKTAAGETPTAE